MGGNTYANITQSAIPKTVYTNEITSPAEATTYSVKVGLMYVSDYGYAASPENWNTTLSNYANDTNRNNNWMYMGAYEWTITRRSDNTNYAFRVTDSGNVNNLRVNLNYGVRPSFYLNSNVSYVSGDGSQNSPFRIQ